MIVLRIPAWLALSALLALAGAVGTVAYAATPTDSVAVVGTPAP
jgi:hypothetical protein